MDHFYGFHSFLRTNLKIYGKEIDIFGPKGIIENVYGAISSYTWNLLEDYSLKFRVHEIEEGRITEAMLDSANIFKPEIIGKRNFDPVILEDPLFRVKTEVLDHKTPVLGFRLEEKDQFGVDKEALKKLGLESGKWIGDAKRRILSGEPLNQAIEVKPGEFMSLEEIRDQIFFIKVHPAHAYLTDIGMTPDNLEKAVRLSKNVKNLFIESPFLEQDRDLAEKTAHLTAYQAGIIAGKAKARSVRLSHFSPRYLKKNQVSEANFYREMEEAKEKHQGE
jgi:ribonuclease Z